MQILFITRFLSFNHFIFVRRVAGSTFKIKKYDELPFFYSAMWQGLFQMSALYRRGNSKKRESFFQSKIKKHRIYHTHNQFINKILKTMFSQIIEDIFENRQFKKLPVINILIWSFTFLHPVMKTLAEILDFLLCTENEKCGIKLI